MANIGTATLTITPKLSGLKQAVDSQLKGVDTKASQELGDNIDKNISGGFAKAGIAAGVFATVTSKVMGEVSSHISSAISRFDTLNNYPTVMENLGYSSEQAQASITKISDRLQTLPTTLDSMVSVVQGLTATVNDLDKATDVGLALNDMLLAAGASTEQTSGAMEQFRRIVAQGKPDMQSWQSITIAMPGQMKQLAEAMLGAGHNADELYTALGGGGAKATISLDELMQKMIEMDTTSTDSFHSFQEQAETAAGGVQTSMDNMGNAITRGITSVMDTIGKENIAGAFNAIKGVINSVFKDVTAGVSAIMPIVGSVGSVIKDMLPILTKLAEGFVIVKGSAFALNGISSIIDGIGTAGSNALKTITGLGDTFRTAQQKSLLASGGIAGLSDNLLNASIKGKDFATIVECVGGESIGAVPKLKALGSGLKGVFTALTSSNAIVLAISLAITAITSIASAIQDAAEKQKTFTKATAGLKEAAANSANLSTIGERYKRVGDSALVATKSVEENAEAMAKVVDTINERNTDTEATISMYQRAQDIINQYAGVSVDSIQKDAKAYGDVTWALDFLNDKRDTNISLQDLANDKYKDADGNVQNLTESINKLVDAKKEQAKQDAITETMKDEYKELMNQEKTLSRKKKELKSLWDKWEADGGNYQTRKYSFEQWANVVGTSDEYTKTKYAKEIREYAEAKRQVDSTRDSIEELTEALGYNAMQSEEYSESLSALTSKMGTKTKDAFSKLQKATGKTKEDFVKDLQAMGVSVTNLGDISDTELADIVAAYDGSEESIQTVAAKITEHLAKSGDAVSLWRDAFADMSLSFDDLARNFGTTADELSVKFAEAGIHAEDMQHISTAAFDGLKEAAGGDIDALMFLIQEYNNDKMYEKTAEVDPSNAEENVKWAKDKLQEWNDKTVEEKTARVKCEGQSALDGLISSLENFGKLAGRAISAGVNGFISGITGNAQGGIRTHADGAIVNNPGRGIPLDIVGEAGAEAIVPLTNTKYAMPFVKMIATEVAKVMTGQANKPTQHFTINANDPNLVATVVAQKQRLAFS